MKQPVSCADIELIDSLLKIYCDEREDHFKLTIDLLASVDCSVRKDDIIYSKETKSFGEIIQVLYCRPGPDLIYDIPEEYFHIYTEVLIKYRIVKGYKEIEEIIDLSRNHQRSIIRISSIDNDLITTDHLLSNFINEMMK